MVSILHILKSIKATAETCGRQGPGPIPENRFCNISNDRKALESTSAGFFGKWLQPFLILPMLLGLPSIAYSALFSDNFDRPLLGADWVVDSGSYALTGNVLMENSGSSYIDAQMRYLGSTTATPDQFSKLQVVSPATHTFGFMFRAGAAPGNHYEVHLPQGSATWRWERYNPGFVERMGECIGDSALSGGNWIGAAITGSGPATEVSVWRWSTDPDSGGPVDIAANWGPPDCLITSLRPTFVDAGLHIGLRAFTGPSTASGFADNWTGGDADATLGFCGDGTLDPGETCDDGDTLPGDGCDEFCQIELPDLCGNGILDPGETCEFDTDCAAGETCAACGCKPPGELFSDDFDRAVLGADWVVDSGSYSLSGNILVENSAISFIDAQMRYVGGTTVSPDQFAKLQVVSSATHTFGFMFRAQSPPGDHYEVHLPYGSAEWRWERYNPVFVERMGTCGGGGMLSDGDWIGAAITGAGPATEVSVWLWNNDPDVGGPIDIAVNWGPPDCVINSPGPAFVDTGMHVGLRAYTGPSPASGFADNWFSGDSDIAGLTTTCGNGVLDPGETCDDSNNLPGDGCRTDCTFEICGDGILDAAEACDDGNTLPGDGCRADCTFEICGDGILDAAEACDDGNTLPGDGCDASCLIEPPVCGNGVLESGETCDDGNNVPGDGCDAVCMIEPPVCGNLILESGETCDDGNTLPGDGCDASCMIENPPICGDGNLDPGEICDDANNVSGDGCRADCTIEICGDSILDPPTETCDDGNTTPGDGCDASCIIEPPPPGSNFSDNFDRPLLGADWVVDSGSYALTGNVLMENSGSSYIDAQMRYLGSTTATPDQFSKLQVVSPATHTFGFMFRAGAAPGNHYEVHLPQGSATWRWERYNPGFVERMGECIGDSALSGGNWIGAAITGSGPATEVSVWRWSTDPDSGGPVDIAANWGPPDCLITSLRPTFVDAGLHIGLRAYTGPSTASGFADNWTGGNFDGQTPPPPPPLDVLRILDSSGAGVPNSLQDPDGVAIDSQGNVYVAACGTGANNEGVWRVTPGGVITQLLDASGDGVNPAICPVGLTLDASENLYVAAFLSDNVFRITPTGTVTQVIDAAGAGAGQILAGPIFVAVDNADSVYVSGHFSDNVLALRPGGLIEEIINQSGDGSDVLLNPFEIIADGLGSVFVTGFASHNIFEVTSAGSIQEILDMTGGGAPGGLMKPHGLALDASSNLYITGNFSDNVLKRTPSGVVTEILNSSGDGAGNVLDNPTCIAVANNGNVYVAAFSSNNVFEITPSLEIRQIMNQSGDGQNTYTGPSDDCLTTDADGDVIALGTLDDNTFRITP